MNDANGSAQTIEPRPVPTGIDHTADGRFVVLIKTTLGSNGEVLKVMDHTAHPAEAAMQATADAAAEDAAVREVMGESE